MLDNNLHLERGLEELGEVLEEREFIFTAEDPLVVLEKRARDAEQKATTPEEYEALSEEIDIEFGPAWTRSDLGMYLQSFLSEKDTGDLKMNLWELLYNAWGHGSNYCENGNVTVKVFLGKNRKILISVEQPGSGFDSQKVFAESEGKPREGRLESHGGGMQRIRFNEAAFGYEKVVTAKKNHFRSLLLQRLKDI